MRYRDPNVLSISQAARFARKDRTEFSNMLREHPEFAQAISTGLPSSRITISLPRLARFLHGECWREVLAQWIVVPSPERSTPAGSLKEPAGIL
jgi:hypothetical protein